MIASINERQGAKIIKDYQLWEHEKQPEMIQTVREYLGRSFHEVTFSYAVDTSNLSFRRSHKIGDNEFALKYHGHQYHGEISDFFKQTKVEGHDVVKGAIEIKLRFPGWGKNNARLVRRIERELELLHQNSA